MAHMNQDFVEGAMSDATFRTLEQFDNAGEGKRRQVTHSAIAELTPVQKARFENPNVGSVTGKRYEGKHHQINSSAIQNSLPLEEQSIMTSIVVNEARLEEHDNYQEAVNLQLEQNLMTLENKPQISSFDINGIK